MQSIAKPEAIFVLGMHRSGTSASAGALARLGVRLGDRLVPPAADNPDGYFEHAAIVDINESLLDALDRSWDDVRALPSRWCDSQAAHAAAAAIDAVLSELDGNGLWALKDPRMSRLLPLWTSSPLLARRSAACLLVIRDPDEVAASLATRDGMPAVQAHILWLRHVLEAVEASSMMPRTVVKYAELLADPGVTLNLAASRLGVDLPGDTVQAGLEEFVRSSARHHRHDGPRSAQTPWHELALECHQLMATSAEPWVQLQALGRRFDALCAAEPAWVECLGQAARAADVRRRYLVNRANRMEQRADALQARLDLTDAALASAERLSLQRMEEAQQLRVQLDGTQAALGKLEALSLERLKELESMRRQLDKTDQALGLEQIRSVERLVAWEAAVARADALQAETVALFDELAATRNRASQLEKELGQIRASLVWRARQTCLSLLRVREDKGGVP